jgi:hypothetical protein
MQKCGNYSREETIQRRKLFEEIWYFKNAAELENGPDALPK